MKKIFTLISMAFVAMSVNAQEIWDASTLNLSSDVTSQTNTSEGLKKVPTQYPGDAPSDEQIKSDGTAALELTDYVFTVSTTNVKLKGVSTPNSDGKQEDAWRFVGPIAASSQANLSLNVEANPETDCKWENYVNAKTGNPSMAAVEYFFTNSDKNTVGPRYVETFWEPGCGKLPAKGEYFEVTFAKAGTFTAGFFINRPNSNVYILEKESITLIPASSMTIKGFVQNNGYTWDSGASGPFAEFSFNDDYTVNVGNAGNRQILAYVTFPVEAKTYLMFNPKNQLGIYGFKFTEGAAGISNVKAEQNADGAIYNLAGQKVDKNFKGIVLKNGKKVVIK